MPLPTLCGIEPRRYHGSQIVIQCCQRSIPAPQNRFMSYYRIPFISGPCFQCHSDSFAFDIHITPVLPEKKKKSTHPISRPGSSVVATTQVHHSTTPLPISSVYVHQPSNSSASAAASRANTNTVSSLPSKVAVLHLEAELKLMGFKDSKANLEAIYKYSGNLVAIVAELRAQRHTRHDPTRI